MQYNGLPVFNIVLNDTDSEFEGLSVVSIVDQPAVCEQLYCFAKEEGKQYIFADETNEKHCITSVALLADCPIYRIDEYGNGYYVVFQKQTIRDLVEKYSKDGYNNLVSFQHNGEIVNDFIMLESYFVDKENGLAPAQFDVPDGSWIVTYKCTNNETWEMVKTELATGGYSVEINCDIEPAPDDQIIFDEPEPMEDEYEDADFWNFLEELMKALEDADCEIVMSQDKKKSNLIIEDEPDDNEGDGWDYLNFAEIERTDISKLINKGVQINHRDYWVYGIGKQDGKDAAILFDPDKKKYVLMPLKDIKQFEPLKASVGEFPPLPNEIVDDDDITVQKTIISNDIPSLLHNRVVTMLSYNDEKENPHTAFRQIAIVAYGITKAGNAAIRAYEMFGDSRSAADGTGVIPDYRMFLLKRIQSLKPMVGTEPWGKELLDSRYNWSGDKGLPTLFDHITESDFQ